MDSDRLNDIQQLRGQILELENRMDFLYKSLNMGYVGGNSGVDPRLIAAIKKGN
jgi:hypothetical protein